MYDWHIFLTGMSASGVWVHILSMVQWHSGNGLTVGLGNLRSVSQP